jgi:arylformamidase
MKIIDLTHLLNAEVTVYPGTEKPVFVEANTVEKDGFAEQKITIYTHTGTHIDAPAHMLKNGKSLDQLNPEIFYGKAICINCSNATGKYIERKDLEPYSKRIEEVDFVLLKTGWSKKWKSKDYFNDFPVLSKESCVWLTNFDLKGIGLDTISIDPIDDLYELVNHHVIFEKEMIIIENLTNLNLLDDAIFTFSCLPLKIENADGSPVRAVAITK